MSGVFTSLLSLHHFFFENNISALFLSLQWKNKQKTFTSYDQRSSVVIGFSYLQLMVLDSGRTGQQCTRRPHRGGPFSCSSWSKAERQLTLLLSTPSLRCMRRAYRDKPSASDCCWMPAHRWDGVSQVDGFIHQGMIGWMTLMRFFIMALGSPGGCS